MAEPTIRPIREADVKQIHEIEKACFAMPWSEESILHDVKENVVARWLVLDDGNGGVLAYAGMWFVLDEAHVCNVAVRPDCRGKGYGKRIFTALIDLAKANSMAMIFCLPGSERNRGVTRPGRVKTAYNLRGGAVNRRCPLFFWRKMEYNIRIRNNGDD